MRYGTRLSIFLTVVLLFNVAVSQTRIRYNNQQLFLSGANLAWINFANDIGPGVTDFTRFGNTLLQIHDKGGNTLRWWLHTTGANTPQFDTAGFVIGPGVGSISDLKRALDMAWEREVAVKLCLWSFDMLRATNSTTVVNRNYSMLTDTNYTRAYINNSLIPMVDSLRGHPAIVAWEIFNEPEGMSNEFYFYANDRHVPMSAIQRFVNMCTGAIHRTDTNALVTNGSWSFRALTDVPTITLGKSGPDPSEFSLAHREQLRIQFNQKYRMSLTTDEVIQYLQRVSNIENFNYYSDSRLIAAGGDPEGTLDFYSVHFYDGLGSAVSPFTHRSGDWALTKAIVVAEFATTQNLPGRPRPELFDTLYRTGYAGALPWSWTDVNLSPIADMLAGMQYMWDNHRTDVDVNGIGGYWPNVSITSPRNDSTFADTTAIPITAAASDSDGTIVSVKFFYADTALIGERTAPPYTVTWTNVRSGGYTLTAVATDNQGHQRTSNSVRINVGRAQMVRREAEAATRQGTGITVRNDATASGGAYLDMATQTGTITWQLHGVPAAGNYEIAFGFKLFYDHPKTQYVNVNGIRADTVVFDATSTTTWLEKSLHVNLNQGDNTIQMELFWGYMYLDYLAIPVTVVASVDDSPGVPGAFSLGQNYPNPFNPSTVIKYELPTEGRISLKVYDVIGREVKTLVNEQRERGKHEIVFDASGLASGVYIYRLQAGNYISSKKMLLMK